MIRITLDSTRDVTLVRLAGRLEREFVEEAERACLPLKRPLQIDVSELQSTDATGLAFLVKVIEAGGGVVGQSEYLARCLRSLRKGRSRAR